ncbi:MAG: KamA family radical SAM protein [Candidatus Omnitrophota bacterium]|nr:MAG: KamA family radical SAM protein [Candidatus Omnitrophota bacterium]
MEEWKDILANCVSDSQSLYRYARIDKKKIEKVIKKYPMRINPYYLSLIKKRGDPIWKQCIPDILEIQMQTGRKDPLKEKRYSPMEGVVHRYKDRVLFLISDTCAGFCRFCTRKRSVGRREEVLSQENAAAAFQYVRRHKDVRDVILSGGDPLTLDDDRIEYYLKNLRQINHVEIIRIDSRTPCVLPQRITARFCAMLKKYSPIYFNAHFNHYRELTRTSRRAADMLAESGVVLGNQAVLLAGVNDDVSTLKKLFEGLLTMRIRPYYLYIPDAVRGTYHFRVSIARALKIMRGLIGRTSGLAIPHLIIDLKHGGGKTPLLPKYIVKRRGRRYVFKNFENKIFYYADIS